ncbi:hypothetical protein Ahy_A02g006870 [Arachis hypogaea]|uniref:Uncharacterized protein n=1 Tax=Arachis hypogaea TaxID=3818 RepID=A0A445EBM2_ARAHY|nr:hypothetical protein Ahy_A02g006870 [Arachis hypogaea]
MEVAFDDNDDDQNGDGGLYDVEVTTTKDPQRLKQSVPTEREQGEHSSSVNKGKEQVVAAGLRDEDDGYESEGLWDVPVSDDEGDPLLRRYPLYKSLKNMKEYKWEAGIMYVDRNAFKECLTSYAVHSGRGIWFSKCDSHRCKAVCKEGCKWFVYCHKMKREDTWQLTSCYKKHTRSKATKIGIMSSQWLSKAFMKKICENPKIRKPIGRPKLSRNKTGDEPRNNGPLSKLSRTGQQQKCSYCFALGHNKRTCPRKRKMEASAKKNATPQAKKGADTTRTPKPSKIPAKTTTQPATKLQPKRKSNTQVGGSQESQTSSKRARCSTSASQPQPSTATVTSPSRRTLRFMAKTPPRAWKALG